MDLRFQVLVCMLAGWLNRQQQDVIEYQREEISVLLEQNGGKPKAFTDSQRRRLARLSRFARIVKYFGRKFEGIHLVSTPIGPFSALLMA